MILIPTAASVLAGYIGLRTKAQVGIVAQDIARVKEDVNGHTKLLVQATEGVARAAGKEEERVERRGRDAASAASSISPIIPPPAAD